MGLKTFLLQLLIAGAISILAFIMILLRPLFLSIIYPLIIVKHKKYLQYQSFVHLVHPWKRYSAYYIAFCEIYWQTIIRRHTLQSM